MSIKRFADYDGQIEHLLGKGLIIKDKAYAKRMLRETGYFSLISGYRTIFYNDDDRTYKDGTTFENIVSLYDLDHELRSIFLEYSLHVERRIKALAGYAFMSRFGESTEAYLDKTNYNLTGYPREVSRLVSLFQSITSTRGKYRYIDHYTQNHENVPLWATLTALTLGSTIKFVECANPGIQNSILSDFAEMDMPAFLRTLEVVYTVRNCCAHNEWLYNFRQPSPLPPLKLHIRLGIPKIEDDHSAEVYVCGQSDMFACVIALKYLLPAGRFKAFFEELAAVLGHYPAESTTFTHTELLELMGFVPNWKEMIDM